jgi:anti-sigma B factor antagonist
METGVQTQTRSGSVVVRVAGEIDMDSAPEVAAALEPYFGNTPHIVVDLGQVTFMDSSGLSVFVAAQQQVGSGQLTLVAVPDRIMRLLELTGLNSVFTIAADVDEALGT